MLLYFSMDECVFCRKMERETLTDPAVVVDINRDFVAASVKAAENDALVRKLQVRTFPATVIISPSSGVVDYMTGYVKTQDFQQRLSDLTGGSDSNGRRLLLGRRQRNP